ncbi:MAG: hypothetical protein GY862_23765 [Gammaproteobacteria bacterium]|nr:hypothetical protein [Gammaproteobacteria bacterium]
MRIWEQMMMSCHEMLSVFAELKLIEAAMLMLPVSFFIAVTGSKEVLL